MTEKNIDERDFVELPIVEIMDEEGNAHRYREEMVIPYDEKYFAILVAVSEDETEEDQAIIARIEQEDGQDGEYVQPTDEEFEAVLNIYENTDL